jgi:hypothetical protein
MPTTLAHPSVEVRRFCPALNAGYQQQLIEVVSSLADLRSGETLEPIERAIDAANLRQTLLAGEGIPSEVLLPTAAYATALRLLRDLVRQGWHADVDDEGVYLLPPEAAVAGTDPSRTKQAVRRSFDFARQAQLADAATARFIRAMERRGIRQLFESGADLAVRLEEAQRRGSIEEVIRPALEEVSPTAVDETTGIRLQDIWRYARHLWSIPYQSTPGRNMYYLVRDDATPARPIIGIAALGNAVLGLAQRDEALGWSVNSLRQRLEKGDPRIRVTIAHRLVDTLRGAIQDVYHADFFAEVPFTEEAIQHLRHTEQEAAERRQRALEAARDERIPEYHFIREAHAALEAADFDSVDWVALAMTDLYTKKRAGLLATLIHAVMVLESHDVTRRSEALLDLLGREEGRRAADVAIRQIKVRAIAENVMEVITCGAVAPYGVVLGGKLVAMLLASPQVVTDFRTRYAGRVSLIASAMKAAPVYRDPELVLLTTSSLYSVGSSQYNRIKIPTGDPRGGGISYEQIGRTDSFGTVHIAPDTAESLRLIAMLSTSRRPANHLFGEGISPKLRTIRTGLDALGLQSDIFLRHHSPRLLYAVKLARNTDDVLLGLEESPDYFLEDDRTPDGSPVARCWRERWLRPRLGRAETLQRLREMGSEPVQISRDVEVAESEVRRTVNVPLLLGPLDAAGPSLDRTTPLEFVEKLYRSSNSYADRLSEEELGWINIDLGLEGYLLDQVERRKQVIVTGNPGDGKTHLIESMRSQLEALGAEVLTDANEWANEKTLDLWQRCAAEGRACVVAINEWPLFVLRRLARTTLFAGVDEAVRQVQEALRHIGPEPTPPLHNVVVIDLNLRNLLSPTVIQSAIERLTQERFYEGLPADDPARSNRDALRQPRVQERLIAMLDLVARRTGHVSMRHLMGFLAYLITGGRSIVERLASQGSGQFHYANLAFDGGEGRLFDQVRSTFDPARITHPQHDFDLWRGTVDSTGWLDPAHPPAAPQQYHLEGREAAFAALKRRFFFEHTEGADLLALVPADETEFDRLVEKGDEGSQSIVRDLILGLNHFFDPEGADSDRDDLVLWQSHRFDVRPPETFVALHRVNYRYFRVEPVKYAPWVSEWLPADQRMIRTFALVAEDSLTHQAVAQLIVDRKLFLTLRDAERGLSRASWSGSATRKVTRFIDRLHQLASAAAAVEDLRVRNVAKGLERRFEIQHEPPQYRL